MRIQVFCATLVVARLMIAQGDAPLSFDAASVKPSSAPYSAGSMLNFLPDGELKGRATTLKALIALAYDVTEFQIVGGPAWMGREKYDIQAKSEDPNPDPNYARNHRRLQALLADRFGLKLHRETKEVGLYVLVLGKDGPKLQTPPGRNQYQMSAEPGLLRGVASMEGLAHGLSGQLGRTVVDETRLKGLYEFKLVWTQRQSIPPSDSPLPEEQPSPPGSVFAAVEEQLGLKLQAQNRKTSVVVVERADKASGN